MKLDFEPALTQGTVESTGTFSGSNDDRSVIDQAIDIFHKNHGFNEVNFEILEGPWMGGYGRFLALRGQFPKSRYADYQKAALEVAKIAKQSGLIISVKIGFNHDMVHLSFPEGLIQKKCQ